MVALQFDAPPEAARIMEEDVHRALDFLIAIEPDPDDDTLDNLDDAACDALMEANVARGEAVTAVLRRYAEQRQPETLESMQAAYYGFTNDPRYLVNAHVSAVVTSTLGQAWDGIGPWRA